MSPLPCAPPLSLISAMRSNIKHRRQRQLRVAGAEQLATAAGEQIFVLEALPPRIHARYILV